MIEDFYNSDVIMSNPIRACEFQAQIDCDGHAREAEWEGESN